MLLKWCCFAWGMCSRGISWLLFTSFFIWSYFWLIRSNSFSFSLILFRMLVLSKEMSFFFDSWDSKSTLLTFSMACHQRRNKLTVYAANSPGMDMAGCRQNGLGMLWVMPYVGNIINLNLLAIPVGTFL